MATEIEVDKKTPLSINGTAVVKFIVSGIKFEEYVGCHRERMKEFSRTSNDMMATKVMNRARLLKQVSAIGKNGAIVALKAENFGALPRQLFVKLVNAIDVFDDPSGKIISENGDGVHKPIVYQLGTPLLFDDPKAGEKAIGTEQKVIELEFIAATGGDIEEVLCHGSNIEQTLAFIATCATPLGGESGLLRLPSWMITNLSLADGFEIMTKVLPIFTE